MRHLILGGLLVAALALAAEPGLAQPIAGKKLLQLCSTGPDLPGDLQSYARGMCFGYVRAIGELSGTGASRCLAGSESEDATTVRNYLAAHPELLTRSAKDLVVTALREGGPDCKR